MKIRNHLVLQTALAATKSLASRTATKTSFERAPANKATKLQNQQLPLRLPNPAYNILLSLINLSTMRRLVPNAQILSILLTSLLFLSACSKPASDADGTDAKENMESGSIDGNEAELLAVLKPTEGNTANGVVAFIQQDDGVLIRGELFDTSPGDHGFHIHETGDCSAADGTSAGGHFNASDSPHGSPDAMADQRHAGDLGNVEVDANGEATYERVDTVIQLTGPNSIRGRAVILHAGTDDLTTQPTGAAGSRIACGVIE